MKFLNQVMLIIFTITATVPVSSQVVVDEPEEEQSVGVLPIRLANARKMFLDMNVRGALNEYRVVLEAIPDHPQATYRIGECHYALRNYELAETYLTQALELNPDVNNEIHYWLGMTKHRLAKLDEAVNHFKIFRSTSSRANNHFFEVDTYIEQCQFAKMMMQEPHDIQPENLGLQINSRFDDYAPSVTADGKLLVFTSRRPDIKGGGIDVEGDHKYFENIFYSEWDEIAGDWTAAEQAKGKVNTTAYDAVLSIAPDGKSMYVYKNNDNSAGDIHFSTFIDSTQRWSATRKLDRPINTSWFESSVSITSDGKFLYFISERPGGEGQGDIYVSESRGENKWGKPKNLGPLVNTEGDEKFVFIHPSGKYLFFASNGHQTMGSYDIFRADIIEGEPTRPVNLGYPINTVNEESTFSLTEDNQTMFIAAEYEGSLGERDIFQIDLKNYNLLENEVVTQVFLQGSVINGANDRSLRDAKVGVYDKDGNMVYDAFTDRNGEFEFKVVRDQVYEIRVLVDGYKEHREMVDLVDIDKSRLVVRKTIALN